MAVVDPVSPRRPARPTGPSDTLGFATALAALAGCVDAIGAVHWRGLFLSFMSGNTTTLGLASAEANWGPALDAARIVGTFVVGIVLGEVLALRARNRTGVLALETVLLASGAATAMAGAPDAITQELLSFAMGLQNASVNRAGGIGLALTYVTGTLVQLGRLVAAALTRSGVWSSTLPFFALWSGFLAGAFVGGWTTHQFSEAGALAFAASASAILASIVARENAARA